MRRSLRGIIKAVISLYLGIRTSQLYPEKKLINKTIVQLANSSENSSTKGGRFASYNITKLSFIVVLMS